MSHIRKQIRDAIKAALTGLALTGSRVYVNRLSPVAATDTPCLVIQTPSEDLNNLRLLGPVHYERTLAVTIDAYVSGATLDDQLDAVCAQIEPAIANAGSLSGLTDYPLTLESVRFEFEDQASPPVAVARLRLTAQTTTLAATPEVRA